MENSIVVEVDKLKSQKRLKRLLKQRRYDEYMDAIIDDSSLFTLEDLDYLLEGIFFPKTLGTDIIDILLSEEYIRNLILSETTKFFGRLNYVVSLRYRSDGGFSICQISDEFYSDQRFAQLDSELDSFNRIETFKEIEEIISPYITDEQYTKLINSLFGISLFFEAYYCFMHCIKHPKFKINEVDMKHIEFPNDTEMAKELFMMDDFPISKKMSGLRKFKKEKDYLIKRIGFLEELVDDYDSTSNTKGIDRAEEMRNSVQYMNHRLNILTDFLDEMKKT
jgi:hypothetical protein